MRRRYGSARRTAAWLLLLIAPSLLGCFDHRREVAFRTLTTEDGIFHREAYAAALSARFPPGAPLEDLRRYVTGAKGECHDREQGSIGCQIPLRGVICGAELARIEASHEEGKIKSLRVVIGGLGC